jgi:thiol-disulfide isomerase/thioredoxin
MHESETPKPRNPMPVIVGALALGVLAGAAVLYVKAQGSGNQAVATQTSCAFDKAQAEALNAAAKGEAAAMLATEEPQPLGDLAFKDPDGKAKSLADFAGRTVLLNLWATWCVPCREEMPALDALQGAAGSGKFEVVAVNVDTGSGEKPKRFLEEIKVSKLAFYQEPDLELFNSLKKRGLVLGLPVTLLVGPDGCLRAAMNGPAKWDSPDARNFIDAALKVTGT